MVRTSWPSTSTSPSTRAFFGWRRSTVETSVDLPQPDSPATPDHLALVDHEVDAAYGGQPALAGPVGDVQVAQHQQLGVASVASVVSTVASVISAPAAAG